MVISRCCFAYVLENSPGSCQGFLKLTVDVCSVNIDAVKDIQKELPAFLNSFDRQSMVIETEPWRDSGKEGVFEKMKKSSEVLHLRNRNKRKTRVKIIIQIATPPVQTR